MGIFTSPHAVSQSRSGRVQAAVVVLLAYQAKRVVFGPFVTQHFVAWTGDIFFSVFVHARIRSQFVDGLLRQGLEPIGTISTPYRVREDLSRRYEPAVYGIMEHGSEKKSGHGATSERLIR